MDKRRRYEHPNKDRVTIKKGGKQVRSHLRKKNGKFIGKTEICDRKSEGSGEDVRGKI